MNRRILVLLMSFLLFSFFFTQVEASVCGNGKCETGETPQNCLQDCPELGFGVAFGFMYKGETFMPYIRNLNTRLTKLYIYWQQIEPEKGTHNWTIIDNFLNQLQEGDEVLIAVWARADWQVSPKCKSAPQGSKPSDMQAYYDFVYELVKRAKGKVMYWQNDCEPTNENFWCGTKEEFVDTLTVFYQAVKAADSNAVVIVGGHDGGFTPEGLPYEPEFFDHVFEHGKDYFDWFDLRLYWTIWDDISIEEYGQYSIPYRVRWLKERMNYYDLEKPMVCTEYTGPLPQQFPQFHQSKSYCRNKCKEPIPPDWCSFSHSRAVLRGCWLELHSQGSLPPQLEMFLDVASPELNDKRDRIHCRDITQRLVVGFSEQVEKFWLWDLVEGSGYGIDPVWGKVNLMSDDFSTKYPAYYCYQRMAEKMQGVTSVNKLVTGNEDIFLFEVQKSGENTYVLWEKRDLFCGEEPHPTPNYDECIGKTKTPTSFSFNTGFFEAKITDVFGNEEIRSTDNGVLSLEVTDTPVYIEEIIKGPVCGNGECESGENIQNCPDDCLGTCSEQGGDICADNENCPGSWLTASDTGRCCSDVCELCRRADTNCNGCIEMLELTNFIARWKASNQDVSMVELMEAIGLWKWGC